jgi:hypothetical protein
VDLKRDFSPLQAELACDSTNIAAHALRANDGEAATIKESERSAVRGFHKIVGVPEVRTLGDKVEASQLSVRPIAISLLTQVVRACKTDLDYKP